MTLTNAKRKLATLWFIFCSLLFILLFLQTLFGKFENKISEAWGWLFPNIIPTLSLMISIFISDLKSKENEKTIDPFYYKLTFWTSIIYLFTILITILSQPFTDFPIIALMNTSNLYLGPLQGIVTASIGLLFIKAHD